MDKKYLSQLNIKYLQAFVLTAEKGSFSSAARAMGKAQSVISNAIANFEIDLNTQLFSRDGRYPELTNAGRQLLPEAKVILERCHVFQDAALSMEGEVESQITIAIDEHLSVGRFSSLLSEFATQFPLVHLKLIHPVGDAIAQAVSDGYAQLGILKRSQHVYHNLCSYVHAEQELDVLVHKNHPLATQQTVSLDTLALHRQVVLDVPSLEDTNPQIVSSQVWVTESAFSAANMVYSGCCWGLLPHFIYSNWVKSKDLVCLTLSDSGFTSNITTDVVWQRNQVPGPAAKWWREKLKSD